MRILISNDDGINAPGLKTLQHIAGQFSDDVWVVAPETNQSGAAHSLTLSRPLRLRQLSERHFAVDGTPTDCVLMAMQNILKDEKIDLMLSGVNHGSNMAEDITYSGTVAAAMEATMFGIKAIALSQVCNFKRRARWSTAEHWGPKVIEKLQSVTWTEGVLMNVNFPDRPKDQVEGLEVAFQGQRKIGDQLIERKDPRGQSYFWIGALREQSERGADTDLRAVHEGKVSITPVHLDMTHYESYKRLSEII